MTKQLLRKTQLQPLTEEKCRTERFSSAFGELVPGYREWYRENYDEQGQVRIETSEQKQSGES